MNFGKCHYDSNQDKKHFHHSKNFSQATFPSVPPCSFRGNYYYNSNTTDSFCLFLNVIFLKLIFKKYSTMLLQVIVVSFFVAIVH